MGNIAGLRKQRMIKMMSLIREADDLGKEIDKEKLVANLCLDWDTSRKTVFEYIRTFVNAGRLFEYKTFDNEKEIILLTANEHLARKANDEAYKKASEKITTGKSIGQREAEQEADEVLNQAVDNEN